MAYALPLPPDAVARIEMLARALKNKSETKSVQTPDKPTDSQKQE